MQNYSMWQGSQLAHASAQGRVEIHVSVSSGVSGVLGCDAPAGRYQVMGLSMALPSIEVTAQSPITVRLAAPDGNTPFPAGAQVIISVRLADGSNQPPLLVTAIPLQGMVQVPLFILARDAQGHLLVNKPAVEDTPTGIAGWYVARRKSVGHPVRLALDGILVDSSTSMRSHEEHAKLLLAFLSDLALAVGIPAPAIRRAPVRGVERLGVGSVTLPAPDVRGRWIMFADLPASRDVALVSGAAPGLVSGTASGVVPGTDSGRPLPTVVLYDTGFVDHLAATSTACVGLTDSFWYQLEREDTAYDGTTLNELNKLVTWLESMFAEGVSA